MFDIGNRTDRERLHKAIKSSRNLFQSRFLRARARLIREACGSHYGLKHPETYVYVNKLGRSARIMTSWLAFNNPQCQITTFNPQLQAFAKRWEVNINKVVSNIDFKTTFQLGLLDAFYLMGCFKVYRADAGKVQLIDNVWADPGKIWLDRISPDDAILDLAATDIRCMRYSGDRYRVSFDAVRERDDFEAAVVKKMTATSKFSYDSASEAASQISTGSSVDDDDLEPMCWLMDVYLPETKQVVTLSGDDETLPPLKVLDDQDQGPMGPYEYLSLGMVPDNALPCSPGSQLLALHRLTNVLYGKMADQAKAQKTIGLYAPGSDDDARRYKEAVNGQWIMSRDPKGATQVSTPGVDGGTHAFFLALQELYNEETGNERAVSGMGASADTLGQEEIIQAHAAGMLQAAKGSVNDCASNLMRKIGSLMWDDETLDVGSSMEAEQTGIRVDSSWRPGERKGLKDHYDFAVEPSSMGYQSPESKLQKLNIFATTYLQMLPAIQAGVFDGQEYARLFARAENMPEIMRLVKQIQEMPAGGPGDPHQATKSPVTSREVVRRSASNGPQGQGMQAVLAQLAQRGGGQQPQPMTAGGGR